MHRVNSIDALRGLAIFLMVTYTAISWESGLPEWMFHHPEGRGLGWAGIIYPLFIFAMGASIPFALSARVKGNRTVWPALIYIVKRCAVLAAFAIVLGNSSLRINPLLEDLSMESPFETALFRAGLWVTFFIALVRTRWKWMNPVGWLAVAGMMAVQHFILEVPFNFLYRDEFIMTLAHLALIGGLLWLAGRKTFLVRFLVLLAVIGVMIASAHFPDAFRWTSHISWMRYLVILIPATMTGDIILDHKGSTTPSINKMEEWSVACATIVVAIAALFQLWALHLRLVLPDLIFTAILAAAFFAMTFKDHSAYTLTGNMGFFMLLCGICRIFVDGGPCEGSYDLSYLLITGGISALLFCVFASLDNIDILSRNLSHAGQNPMIAYTIAGFIIVPLLYAAGFMEWFDELCQLSPLLGICRGLVVALLMLLFTCLFTRFKIFWRS